LAHRIRRSLLAVLVVGAATMVAAAPTLAATTSLSVDSAAAAGPSDVTVGVAYSCSAQLAATSNLTVHVVDLDTAAHGQASVTATCDGSAHVAVVTVPVASAILAVHASDQVQVTADLDVEAGVTVSTTTALTLS